jgi:glycosyltransferase involved in cell wall biosynthesis
MKNVALLTTFFDVTSGYSLVAVAETQIRMLLDGGYMPTVLVQNRYHKDKDGQESILPFLQQPPPSVWNEQTVDLRAVVPAMDLPAEVPDDFEERADRVEAAIEENLKGIDVCITHDIVLQPYYLPHNAAVRRYAKKRPDLLWLHWLHSCPSHGRAETYPESLRSTPPPGYLVYPNDSDKAMVVRAYGLAGQEWRVKVCRAGHAIDPLLKWPYDRLTKDLARKADLMAGEVAAIYPARLDRGKQVEKAVRLMVGVQRAGYEPRLLVVDWQSAGQRFQSYIDELLALAKHFGLEGKINFTSRLDDSCSQGVPPQVVTELFSLTNVYIHPSAVETYSLVVHEAALQGNLLVLNHDFPAMRELYGDAAIYMDFGSDRAQRTYEDEQTFWNEEAKRLIAELRGNRALWAKTRARREWTPPALWKEFEPLLYLQPIGE